ncbi:hypothetical protein WAI453_012684 [Rhynchosporium graminicola]
MASNTPPLQILANHKFLPEMGQSYQIESKRSKLSTVLSCTIYSSASFLALCAALSDPATYRAWHILPKAQEIAFESEELTSRALRNQVTGRVPCNRIAPYHTQISYLEPSIHQFGRLFDNLCANHGDRRRSPRRARRNDPDKNFSPR